MKNSFLRECATELLNIWGDSISEITILLPTRRSITFFKKELTELLQDRAIWQPSFVGVGEIMSQISSIRQVQPIVLLSELYKVYSKYYDESFDKFYYWGNIILSDFSTIDNYCCDAKLLFSNISDLSEIDNKFDYLSQGQKEMILQFWSTIRNSDRLSSSQSEFVSLWNNLYPIYTEFKERLLAKGIGYSGMIYRNAAELLSLEENRDRLLSKDYAIIGFNALSRSEEQLFTTLKEGGRTLFFWDYDNYYIDNSEQEAGAFIRKNIEKFSQVIPSEPRNNFSKSKKISVIDAPSEVLGCKWAGERVKQLIEQGEQGEQSAIILTNESMLIPLLYSIPSQVENINVTSGYPLNLSSAYTLFDTLTRVQLTSVDGKIYYKEFLRVVNHPYIKELLTQPELQLTDNIKELINANFTTYIPKEELCCSETLSLLFSLHTSYTTFSSSIIELFVLIALKGENSLEAEQLECINKLLEQTSIVRTTIENGEISLSLFLFIQLLKKHLNSSKITLEGEPLKGLQVMGILESRNIDFKNLFILSLSEDNYPSVKSINSLIPSNLREGYGLPTVANHEAMYSYYLYRLLQRAENIELIYSSYSGDSLSGEASRYIHQLLIESPHKNIIEKKSISLQIAPQENMQTVVAKTGRVWDALMEFKQGKRVLSASRLYEYIECPLRFYFHTIERIDQPVEISDELDAAMAGNVLHRTLEQIFQGAESGKERAAAYLSNEKINTLVESAITEQLKIEKEAFNGRIETKKIEICHAVENILKYELDGQSDFATIGCEYKISTSLPLDDTTSIKFVGSIDRIDSIGNDRIRIVDYKSGKSVINKSKKRHCCNSLDDIMDSEAEERNRAMFQTLLYSLFISNQQTKEVTPTLYFARDINQEGYQSTLTVEGEPLYIFSAVKERFSTLLSNTLQELFNSDINFSATNNNSECKWCHYNYICNKKEQN